MGSEMCIRDRKPFTTREGMPSTRSMIAIEEAKYSQCPCLRSKRKLAMGSFSWLRGNCKVSDIAMRNAAQTGLNDQTVLGKVALHSQLRCISRVGHLGGGGASCRGKSQGRWDRSRWLLRFLCAALALERQQLLQARMIVLLNRILPHRRGATGTIT